MSIRLYDWLDMINTYFNPYNQDVKQENLNILMYSNGSLWSTTGYAQSIESFFDYTALLATPEPTVTPEPTLAPEETQAPPEGETEPVEPPPVTPEPAPPAEEPVPPPLESAPSAEDPPPPADPAPLEPAPEG